MSFMDSRSIQPAQAVLCLILCRHPSLEIVTAMPLPALFWVQLRALLQRWAASKHSVQQKKCR